jgi:hypothetical protein
MDTAQPRDSLSEFRANETSFDMILSEWQKYLRAMGTRESAFWKGEISLIHCGKVVKTPDAKWTLEVNPRSGQGNRKRTTEKVMKAR